MDLALRLPIKELVLKFAELKKALLKKEIYLYSNIEFLIN
ncbi:hypothetical protein SMU21_06440 [Streptococcus mutans 1SM1]|uniref:Uncharacterized protein n=1 Tax=Streptococcus mutans SM6 TaxID=857119 RepID=A0A829BSQ4_STRMG|nr:hypothetical protein SMU21_06440 [Streptococcus mutans 1SM1]EMB65990.1 hypothetical protein SMU26_05933 [Streptococcus mutans 3SN1]EMB69386.1 hypothetical protein SMU33_08007 [Streptococcus mutans 11SSST2]EMB78069.1 hypothetical protein SMU44_07345 [Streptococcus mutans 11VS1]EMB90197.1 hypothetical protein SMU58_07733 [Streptococcus mutans A19]EMB95841.1 hypothetical protein SMU60_00600 [Streptococcus mutans U138]EMC07210.1 hypothetical protein SMU70_02006 [Streptococcus mutans NLML5]EMC